jgi:hypothetical protein
MSIERIDPARLVEAVKLLATTATSLRLAAQAFRDLEQFADTNWDRDCYACFDWIALSRRMFRRAGLALDDLHRNYKKEFENTAGTGESVAWCHERIANIMDRLWFERSGGPQEITATLHNALARLELVLDTTVAQHERVPSLINISVVQAVLQKPATSDQILADPAASFWIKDALRAALRRDPVDAANDAQVLAQVLDARCEETLKASLSEISVSSNDTGVQAKSKL